LRGRGAAVLWI